MILSECAESTNPTKKVACLVDNHHISIDIQKMNADEDVDNEEVIVLNSFLGVIDSKVILLIEVMAQTDENHNFEQVRVLDQNYKNGRFTCQFRSTALVQRDSKQIRVA